MSDESRASRLPPAREPSADQLAKVAARSEGMARLGPEPRMPPIGNRPQGQLPRILLVDDEASFIDNTRSVWERTKLKDHANLEFFLYSSSKRDYLSEILKKSFRDKRPFDTVYIDVNLGGSGAESGIGLIERLREEVTELRYIPFVAITSHPDPERERRARERGAIRFIIKTSQTNSTEIVGSFVHRMIFEARETLEQVEDQLWADAAAYLAERLRHDDWTVACAHVLDFIHINFSVKALYARRIDQPDILVEIAAKDHLGVDTKELNIAGIPFLHDFMKGEQAHKIIESIDPKDAGHRFADHVKGHHAVLARVGVGRETFGLLTMYRPPEERPFRTRDAEGLSRLASLLAAAITQERLHNERIMESNRLRQRQKTLLDRIRGFDSAADEDPIWEQLRDTLFEAFTPSVPGSGNNLKVTVRRIRAGTSIAERPCPQAGLMPAKEGGPLSLENIAESYVARAIWNGASLRNPDLDYDRDHHEFLFRNSRTRSALTVPAMDQGICVGAVNLECLLPDAFSEADQDFVELLAQAATSAILRLRARRFLEGMTDIAATLAEPEPTEAKTLIRRVMRLLFDFTGCSEILYIVPQGEHVGLAWELHGIFQRDSGGEVVELVGEAAQKWQGHVTTGWESSVVYKVLNSGNDFGWRQAPDIELTDEEMSGRGKDRKTRAQAVIVVRQSPAAGPEAVISLLIQHRHALSDVRSGLLKRCGSFLASLLRHNREVHRMLGEATIREQEARLGQVMGQVRHSLRGRLAQIRQHIVLVERGYGDWSSAADSIKNVLTDLEREFHRNRWIIKNPELESVDLGELWISIRADLVALAEGKGCEIKDNQLSGHTVTTDGQVLRAILFNLVDNALRHGGAGAVVSASAQTINGKMVITVRDTGNGIAESVQKRLFEPMTTTTSDSTGLGLYLTRHRANDLGADLKLVRTGSEGTSFEVVIPNA